MNFGINRTANTSSTIINETVLTTPPAASDSTTPAPDSFRKDTKTLNIETENFSKIAVFGKNTNNIINQSKSFTTPQNSLDILSSIQNYKISSNPGSCESLGISAASKITTLGLLTLESSTSSASLEAVDSISNRKLDDLEDKNKSTILNNYSNIECTAKPTLYSTIENDINQSFKIHTEQSFLESIDWQENTNDSSLSSDKISINCDEDSLTKLGESCRDDSNLIIHSTDYFDKKSVSRLSERAKKKSWYNVLYPNYKSRSQEFKKLFKEVPKDERLIVDFSCALYRDLLIQGRLYISQNYVCFHANILGWETCLIIKWKDVTSITKEKTALVIPNAISICTPKEKFFFSSFTTRDKTFLILFRVWQNTLMNKPMPTQEIWQLVHNYYGDELGLTTDDEDYVDPTVDDQEESTSNLSFLSTVDNTISSTSVSKRFEEQENTKYFQQAENSSGNSASDNNSGDKSSTSGSCLYIETMKTNSKEITLISANPEDGTTPNSQTQLTSAVSAGSYFTSAVTANDDSTLKDSKHNTSTFDSKRKVSKSSRQREENTNKNSEAFPTDVSDSSDSEDNNIPDLLIQGRLYISQNYVCFHANILGWETCLIIKWKDVTSITKEKTALVIPNAISICTPKEKFFFSSFTTRDKTFLILFRVWQNTLMNKPMPTQEIWQLVHNYYGDELGLTTDDEDYVDPTVDDQEESTSNLSFLSTVDNTISSTSVSKRFEEQENTKYFQQAENSSGNSASDNNSGDKSSTSGSCLYIETMKTNSKEITLISANPEDGTTPNSQTQLTSAVSAGSYFTSAVTANDDSTLKDSKHNTSTFDSKRKVSKSSRQREENTNKNSEAFPTDVSDSSDSEDNNIPFVATAECNSPHEGRQLVHTILPINIETLFNLLFSKSKFLLDFHAMRKSTDLVFNDWITNEDGQKTRTFNVTVQLAASVGPKTSKVTEFQVMRDCSKPGELYSIDINNVNAGIPYADSFSVLVHYCLVKTVDDHTMLSVHGQIKYKKSIWGVVKGFIEKNTWAGLDDFYTSLLRSLQSETCIPPAKGKGRRPRRGTATQIRPLEEISILLTKPEPTELCGIVPSISTRHSSESPILAEKSTTNSRWLSLFVLVLLCFLIIVNVILLLKLWKLEDRIVEDMSVRARFPNLSALKQLPNNHQDWIELLRQQEVLHKTELKKWQTVLQTAIELLKKVSVVCQSLFQNDKIIQRIDQISDEL